MVCVDFHFIKTLLVSAPWIQPWILAISTDDAEDTVTNKNIKSFVSVILSCQEYIWIANSMIYINTTSDISKVLYIISQPVRRVKFGTISKYHAQNHAIICL